MSIDQAFDRPVRGFGQDPLGNAVGSDGSTTDGGNSLISGGAEGGTSTSQLLGPGGADPIYTGTTVGGGGTSGGGSLGPSSSGSGSSGGVSGALQTVSDNAPLIVGALVVAAGIAGALYLANHKKMQGSSKPARSRRSSFFRSRSYARRR